MDCIVHGVTKSWTQLGHFYFHLVDALTFHVFSSKIFIFASLWMCQHSILRILTLAVYVAVELTFKRLKLKCNYQARKYFN